jgi:hypothetical protein
MAAGQRDHQHRGDRVDDVGDLHRGAVVLQARHDHVEHPPRRRQDQPEKTSPIQNQSFSPALKR